MKINNNSIALIIPYFGEWPDYFDLFLKGCENNNWLNIIFFTDCSIPEKKYNNLTFYKSSLKQTSNLYSLSLGITLELKSSYKLCDFRPCYGVIYKEYLENYKYWGYGDIDLIYGNLKPFIFDRINNGYDILSSREEILSGSLSLFKNTDYINHLFKKSETLINLLSSPNYEGLDETVGQHMTWHGENKLKLPKHCFTYIIANENINGKIKASFETICKEKIQYNEIIYFDEGNLMFKDRSLGYFHFVCNKNNLQFKFPNWQNVPNNFFITETGFYTEKKNFRLINNYRKALGFIKEISVRIWKRIIKK